MTWTQRPPNAPGWWWYRLERGSQEFPLIIKQGDGVLITGTGKHVDRMRGEWSDEPIPIPVDAKTKEA